MRCGAASECRAPDGGWTATLAHSFSLDDRSMLCLRSLQSSRRRLMRPRRLVRRVRARVLVHARALRVLRRRPTPLRRLVATSRPPHARHDTPHRADRHRSTHRRIVMAVVVMSVVPFGRRRSVSDERRVTSVVVVATVGHPRAVAVVIELAAARTIVAIIIVAIVAHHRAATRGRGRAVADEAIVDTVGVGVARRRRHARRARRRRASSTRVRSPPP